MMFAHERQKFILSDLAANGAVFVSELSKTLSVSEETVRRDLEKLESVQQLKRTHGGAIAIDDTTQEISLEKRKKQNVTIKEKVAEAASKYVIEGDTIFLDASTTTFYLSKQIRTMENITVITNSLRIINELEGTKVKVIAIGGILSENMSMVGTVAENSIADNYFASKMFFSSKGVTKDAGILESNEQESGIKQKMILNSKEKYYLCDNTKIGRVGFVKLVAFEDVDYFVTNAVLDVKWTNKLKENKIEYIYGGLNDEN